MRYEKQIFEALLLVFDGCNAYKYAYSATCGDSGRIGEIKEKPEMIIVGGNMFYIDYQR